MRWDGQRLGADDDASLPGLPVGRGIPGLLRTVTTPEFAGIRFHEVLAKSLLNHVPAASGMPFGWTINTFRGCSHACTYCFARGTHAYLDLDTGADFDREIVVKTNAVEVLQRELARPSWRHEHVALGTNTDPYQRAEGRYRLMPGVIDALAASGTPFSVLTKGTLLRRDLPLLQAAAAQVPVGVGVSLAVHDDELQHLLEPGTPSVAARLELVRAVREAGLPCGVFLAPVLPALTDGLAHLDHALASLAAAGATGVTVVPLHLRPGTKEWFMGWLERERPELVPRYRTMYGRGAYASPEYRRWLRRRVQPLLARYGLDGGARTAPSDEAGSTGFPDGSLPRGVPGRRRGSAVAAVAAAPTQLSML
ncbi:Rv2578c family radical SAM protein [Angustibacter aerolatus]